MHRRIATLMARCSVMAVWCLAASNAARGEGPGPAELPAAPVAVAAKDGPADAAKGLAAPGLLGPVSTLSADASGDCAGCLPGPACCQTRGPRVWVTGEYLMWWFKDSPQPVPLVTSVPANLVPPSGVTPSGATVGSLLDTNATVVLGGRDIDTGVRSGGRFTVGCWLDDAQQLGLEANYFFIAPKTVTQTVTSPGLSSSPLLSIPYFDVTGDATPSGLPGEDARPIASPPIFELNFPAAIPGQTAAVFTQRLESRLQGAEANALLGLSPASDGDGLHLAAIGGFRYLNLRESLTFSSALNAGPLGFPDVIYDTLDQFTTTNDFYGAQLGVRGEYRVNRLVLQARAAVALGGVHERATIDGATLTNLINGPGTPPLAYPGGIFAQPSNIGTYSRDVFAVVPQADFNVGYQVTDWARVFLGYSLLYLSDAARPGAEINRSLNVTRIPFNNDPNGAALVPTGAQQPAFSFRDASFWAQGINFGVEFRY